jgi:protein-disulfide isomerase
MTRFAKTLLAAAAGFMLLHLPASAEMTAAQKTEFETLIRDYLLDHPEILTEMSQKLEIQQKEAEDKARVLALKANADLVFRSAADPSVGSDKPDVTVVEFIDYNCGWCKKSVNELNALLETDKQVKVVFKEFPIFGEGSEYAAKAVMAANKQGKYWEMHQALFAQETRVDAAVVDEVAKSIGVDVAKMKTDMADASIQSTIDTTRELARALLINGTPAFIVDEKLIPGYVPSAQLAETIQSVRTNGCKLC